MPTKTWARRIVQGHYRQQKGGKAFTARDVKLATYWKTCKVGEWCTSYGFPISDIELTRPPSVLDEVWEELVALGIKFAYALVGDDLPAAQTIALEIDALKADGTHAEKPLRSR